MRFVPAFFVTLALLAPAAHAQEDVSEQLDRLERDVNFLQKQVYRGGATDGTGAPITNAGQVEVRFSQMDEQIRQIRGQIEQTQFQAKKASDDLKKLSDDVDFRLRALEQKQAAMDAAAAAAPAPVAEAEHPSEPAKYQAAGGEAAALTGNDFPDANAHYSHAFKLLNEKKYAEAGASFDAFVKKYPSDPLTSNSYYWLGESYYARQDYTRAAESFRKGYEANTDGQKAPDNLLKLAMSLNQVKRTNEACIVLKQVMSKYAEASPRTAQRASDQHSTMQCK